MACSTTIAFFEVDIWMWRCGRVFPRKILVEDAEEMRRVCVKEFRCRAAETLKRRRLAAAAREQDQFDCVNRIQYRI